MRYGSPPYEGIASPRPTTPITSLCVACFISVKTGCLLVSYRQTVQRMTKKLYQSFSHWLVISVYLLSLPVAVVHLSDAPRRRLVVTGESARIQDETTESFAWFFNVHGVFNRHTGPRFNVSSERQLVLWLASRGFEPTTCGDPKHCADESYALPTELYRLIWFKHNSYTPRVLSISVHIVVVSKTECQPLIC